MGLYADNAHSMRLGTAYLLPELAPMSATMPAGDDGVPVAQVIGRRRRAAEAAMLPTVRRTNPVVENILGICGLYRARQALHTAGMAEPPIPEHSDEEDTLEAALEEACRLASHALLKRRLQAERDGGEAQHATAQESHGHASAGGPQDDGGAAAMDLDTSDVPSERSNAAEDSESEGDLGGASAMDVAMDDALDSQPSAKRRGAKARKDLGHWVSPVERAASPATASAAAIHMRQSTALLAAHAGFLGTTGCCC